MGSFKLNNSMKLGVVCASPQAGAGKCRNTWNDWYAQGKMRSILDPSVGGGHRKHWRQDIMLMRRMGIETCRISAEWALIEPAEGEFSEKELDRLKEEILLMSGLGIRPLLTLHYFTNPSWFEEKGGWEKADNIRFFLSYAEKLVSRLGHLVNEYITINEPNTFAYHGYYTGDWPPGKKSLSAAMQVVSVMASAHIRCYKLIHSVRRSLGFTDTKAGCSVQMRVFEPKYSHNPIQSNACALAEKLFQSRLIEAVNTGKFVSPLKNVLGLRFGQYCDFHALSYGSRSTLSGLKQVHRGGEFKDDLENEIYPDGIIRCAWKMMDICRLPIYITESGVCDRSDGFRAKYIYDQLEALCRSELPVKRYYYRSFLDGLEWPHGYGARFGLVHTNFTTMERSIKDSGKFYSRIIEERGVSEELFGEFVAELSYHR